MSGRSLEQMTELSNRLAAEAYGDPADTGETSSQLVDDASGRFWLVTDDRIRLALRVALATGRPLLVRGNPGTGKSTLARAVARTLGWRYLAITVTSRTEASDLQWRVDHLTRLRDAQLGAAGGDRVADLLNYVEPGLLWWAFNPGRAAQLPSGPRNPAPEPEGRPAVVLIDEIDKADPETPDNLLEVLGWLRFQPPTSADAPLAADGGVGGSEPGLDAAIAPESPDMTPLVIITSNNERDLSPAFMRRCVKIDLVEPPLETLRRIALGHLPNDPEPAGDGDDGEPPDTPSADAVAAVAAVMGEPGISPAVFVDAARAALALRLTPDSDELAKVRALLLDEPPEDD